MCYGEKTTAEIGGQTRLGATASKREQSEGHTVEQCTKLTELKREVGRDEKLVEMRSWSRDLQVSFMLYDFLSTQRA